MVGSGVHSNYPRDSTRSWNPFHAPKVGENILSPTPKIGKLIYFCSPRWLMVKGREEECLAVIANLRSLPADSELVQLEYLEVKAQDRFEKETSLAKFPQYHSPGWMNKFKLGFHEYASLVTNRSLFKRTIVAVFIMVFQQCMFMFSY